MFGLTAVEVFVAIIIVFIVLYWITPRKNIWFPLAVVTVLLAVLAYNMVPYDTDDLVRYYQEIRYMRNDGIEELHRAFKENLYEWNTYRVAAYYFYFISFFPDNRWLQTVTIFIVYGLMLLVIYKAANRFNIDKFHMFIGIMFFLSTYWYYDTASGIRNGLSFAVSFACAYYHLVERKNIPLCYVGYILATFTHSAGIMPVLLVLIAELTLNTSGKFINFVLMFGLSGGGILIKYLSEKTDNSFIQSIAGKAERHSANGTLGTGTMFWVNVVLLVVLVIFFIYVSYYFLNSEYSHDLKRLYKYTSITIYFMLGAILSGLIFVRFARWILPALGALIFMIGMQIQSNQIKRGKMICPNGYVLPSVDIRVKLRPIVIFLFCAFTAVHFWYLCNGSSLHWIKFD